MNIWVGFLVRTIFVILTHPSSTSHRLSLRRVVSEGYLRSNQSLETGGWRRGTNRAAGWKRKHSILPENHEISQRKHAGHCRLHSPTNKAPLIMNQTTRTPKSVAKKSGTEVSSNPQNAISISLSGLLGGRFRWPCYKSLATLLSANCSVENGVCNVTQRGSAGGPYETTCSRHWSVLGGLKRPSQPRPQPTGSSSTKWCGRGWHVFFHPVACCKSTFTTYFCIQVCTTHMS
jgi:hypothetical protein